MSQETQTLGFQAEVKQLLHLMIHSLYSNKEIFLRELISNASDALDKLRFEALERPQLLGETPDLHIDVDFDSDAGTITVVDNGIGMSRQELIDNLGTIARSGTSEFLQQLTGDRKHDAQLIGQFGVGFYSAFIVADRVTVRSRRADLDEAASWESDGQGEFCVAAIDKPARGTQIVLHLKPGEREFADGARLRSLVRKYSDHIAFPVRMGTLAGGREDADREVVNAATALWARNRNEIEDQEYREFYKHISHDVQDPLAWSHNRVEGKREYTSLLYIPAHAPFDLWNRDVPRGLKLYVQRVFVMDQAEQFLPLYLRFVRGVVDSSDLPLNVSRELLQGSPLVEAIRGALVKRTLDLLERLAGEEPDKYQAFWNEFGQVLKEGPVEDPANAPAIASLLRFATSTSEGATQDVSLKDYVGRMAAGQQHIYYIIADSHQVARNSPHLESLSERGIEVLLLSDRIDEWTVSHLGEFEGRDFRDVTRGELDLPGLGKMEEARTDAEPAGGDRDLLQRIAAALADQVQSARASTRLTQSPACLVADEHDPGLQMRRLMELTGQKLPGAKPILEINPAHPLVQRLAAETDQQRFQDLAGLLFEQASLAEGGRLEDPAGFVRRLNRLLLDLSS